MGFNGIYPLVIADIAVENDPVEIESFPINSIWRFSTAMLDYQRVGEHFPTSTPDD